MRASKGDGALLTVAVLVVVAVGGTATAGTLRDRIAALRAERMQAELQKSGAEPGGVASLPAGVVAVRDIA
jgi:hypothetical protein